MGTTELKSKRYATQKDMAKLTDAVNKLTERMVEVSAWQTYHILKDTPNSIPEDMRKEIREKNTGLLRFLYNRLFADGPKADLALLGIKEFPSEENCDCVDWSIKIHEWQEKFPSLFPSSLGFTSEKKESVKQ